MTFDEILAPLAAGPVADIPPGWGQGRATFGGLVAALLYRRARAELAAQDGAAAVKLPRSLSFSLVAPLAPGPARVEVDILRAGRNVTQVLARILQDAGDGRGPQVAAAMLGSFGGARESGIRIDPAPVPAYAAPASLPTFPYVDGVTPQFTRHYEFRWAVGVIPFTAPADTGDMGGWVRFREPTDGVGTEHLLALVDAWPPAVLPMFRRPAPISTLAWTIEFTDVDPGSRGDEFFGYLAQTDFALDGYAHINSRFWRADGTLLAIGRQTVAIFA